MVRHVPQIIFYWIVLAATALRLRGISLRSLWFDEALSWKLQSFPFELILHRTGEPTTTHPPFYFLVLRLWSRVWGDSEVAMRSLSVLLGVATVLLMFQLIRSLGSLSPTQKTADAEEDVHKTMIAALLACGFLALSNLHIHQAQQVRGYTLAAFLTVLSSVFLVRALSLSSHARMMWCGYVGSAIGLCYTHNLGLFSIFAQGAFAVLYLWMPRFFSKFRSITTATATDGSREHPTNSCTQRLRPSRISFVIATIVITVAYLPWLTRTIGQTEKLRSSWTRPLTKDVILVEVENALTGTSTEPYTRPSFASWGMLAGLVLLWGVLTFRCGPPGVFLAMLGAIPSFLICLFSWYSDRSIFDARYLMFAQLAWLAAAAWLLSRIRFRTARVLFAVLSVSVCAYVCLSVQGSRVSVRKPGMRGAIQYVLQQRTADEAVIAETPFVFFGSQFYARNDCQVHVVAQKMDRFRLNGESQLLTSDLITPGEVATREFSGIWVVSSASYMANAKSQFPPNCAVPPENWSRVETRTFEQDYYWEDVVQIQHYVRRRGFQ